ncbi:uncharacterized protein LOC141600874 [Silene latifolia]|uniref:uncharacterized protein LOC141600874 n=1 Tax=Silene latifolia TaxID=37657 RepID=UPI003D76EC36
MKHLFWDCEIAKRTWACSDLGIRDFVSPTIGLAKWVINWIRYLDKMVDAEFRLIRFLATLWCLWCSRNRVLFKGEPFYPMIFLNMLTQVVRTVDQTMGKTIKPGDTDTLNEQESQEKDLARIRDSSPIQMIGMSNSCEGIRVMVDARWKSVTVAGIGRVALTGSGNRFYTKSKAIKAESVLQAETIGIKEVLLWAKRSGFWHLEVSSDCLPLICHFAGIESSHHLALEILEDIQSLCSFFSLFIF